ncbi:MAG: hypothetical protein ACE5FA_08815 [Dehalococcoidia bacterium]
MSWWSRSHWGEKQNTVTGAANGASAKLFDAIDGFTRTVIDDVLFSMNSTATGAGANFIQFYNGDPSGSGTPLGPAVAVSTGGNGSRCIWVRDIGLRFNRNTEVWVFFTMTNITNCDVFVNAHDERGK